MDFGTPEQYSELKGRLSAFLEELSTMASDAGLEEGEDIPEEMARRVRRLSYERGFFTQGVAPEHGGGGLPMVGMAVLREEIARSANPLGGLVLSSGVGILGVCTGEQRARYLEPVVRGEKSYAFALTEPRSGSDPRSLHTTARRQEGNFILSGMKSFVSGGHRADFAIVVAQVVDEEPGGTSLFLVDRDTPGLSVSNIFQTIDGSRHCEYVLNSCSVPEGNLLGAVGQGLPAGLGFITRNRVGMAASAVGTARRALEMTLERVKQPQASGQPLTEREQVQAMLADMATDIYAARTMAYDVAEKVDAGQDVRVEAAMLKLYTSEMAGRVVDAALQLHGGAAVIEGHPLERMYRQVRGWRIAEGASEVLRGFVGREMVRP